MMTTFTNYQLISRDIQKSLARVAAEPVTAREVKYYLENIEKVKSIDDFLGNHRLYAFAMKAYGLEDMTYAKAFMRKVLTEGVSDKSSFANRLADERYKEFAKVFDFKTYGETTTTFERARQGTVDNYIRQSLEISAGQEDAGVRLALYFERKAPGINSPYDILADPALLQVVQTALNIPETASGGGIDAQAAMIEHKLDIDSLSDPEKVKRFLQRFTTMWDAKNNAASSPVLTLFTGSSASAGMNVEMLMSLQRVKYSDT
ncbi:DUF1217 domain-containing protein [Microvirga thermotolerans]|uniref:DUF1217 domain-containing protein n=1 Tax=Microvirga thermotolerans TaxID=2651334 RepID=A0A5P9JYH1_9HYPH|nr:DUF1217 domain-containing protein [Microvirga thermotolerans]QFU17657.1 DUF1217 domain-containing protein [Microvirga thermotolerans]